MTALTPETASEFDFLALIDASGSMNNPSLRFPGKTRWQEQQESVTGLAFALEKFDADGIDVVAFGPGVDVEEGVTGAAVPALFARRGPRGSTPLAPALQVVIDKQKRTGKKTVAVIYTDGAPDNPDLVVKTITDASNALSADDELTFLFIQVGDDPDARRFLDHLDDKLTGKFDIVDVVSVADADNLEPLELITKAIAD
jgi:hypothetical protein